VRNADARPTFIADLHRIAGRFDDVLLDQWGALHDGKQVFPAARDCIARLRAAGKRVLILSNSGRRAGDNMRRLATLGLASSAYDGLLTSGEVAWQGLRERVAPPFDQLGRRCYLITRGSDRSFLDGLDIAESDDLAIADFILLAGLDDGRADPESWGATLAAAARRRLPMLCTNPDLTMFGTGGLLPAPGAVAALFYSLGGQVHYIGKPFAPMFAAALRELGCPTPKRTLVIGDSLDHDILGGRRAGMLTALISSGVHAAELGDSHEGAALIEGVRRRAADNEHMPDWVIPRLAW